MGVAPDRTTLIESIEEADALDFPPGTRLAVTCQTTLSMWDTQAIIDRLVERFPEIEVHNEICRATQERQEAAVLAADDVDCVVVVGSRRSSNSRRLAQVVEELGHKPAHLVDTAAELRPEWFEGVRRVGVTSGASTPTHLTREVVAALEAMPDRNPETARLRPDLGRRPAGGRAGRRPRSVPADASSAVAGRRGPATKCSRVAHGPGARPNLRAMRFGKQHLGTRLVIARMVVYCQAAVLVLVAVNLLEILLIGGASSGLSFRGAFTSTPISGNGTIVSRLRARRRRRRPDRRGAAGGRRRAAPARPWPRSRSCSQSASSGSWPPPLGGGCSAPRPRSSSSASTTGRS